MHAGFLGGVDHFLRVYVAKTGNVFTDGAVKQFDVLGQVTNIRANFVTVVLGNYPAIQAYIADL